MRSVEDWRGKTDDVAIPARVKVRIFERYNGRCCICTRKIGGNLRSAYDHVVALSGGGSNSENNIQLLCSECHKQKTRSDVAVKSKIARVRKRHLGIKKKSRFPGSKDSGWRKKMDGTVVRR